MSSLLPPNATRAERAIEAAICTPIADIPSPQRDLWNPDKCPVELLPWLAWALSVDAWKPWWPEHVKRSILRSAIQIQRRKGTVESVCKVIESFGGSVLIREWWQQDPPGKPHTFEVILTLSGVTGVPTTAEYADDVINEVRRTKPVRSHFTFTQGLQGQHRIGLMAGVRPAVYRRLTLAAHSQDTP